MDEYMESIKNASGDIWKLFKTFSGIKKDDDEMWEKFLHDADDICSKYKGTGAESYAKQYAYVIIGEIERKG